MDAQTEADRRVEEALLTKLSQAFPQVTVVGEESSEGALDVGKAVDTVEQMNTLQSPAALQAISADCKW